MKTRAMVNSTSGTKRATEMGPVHLNHHNMTSHLQSFVVKITKNVRGVFPVCHLDNPMHPVHTSVGPDANQL